MSTDEQGALVALDPDAPAGRSGRSSSTRLAPRGPVQGRASDDLKAGMLIADAEATLNLEPLRLPIAAMVQATLRTEREAIERMGLELRSELALLHDWRMREEAMRVDQTALYHDAAEQWKDAGDHAVALCRQLDRLEGIAQVLHAAIEAAINRFWGRALLAAWFVALTGFGVVGGLCGVVWLALAQR